MKDPQQTATKFVERIEVAGDQLVSKINELIRDVNARRVVIKDQRGHELLTLPLNVSVVAGGVLTLASPVLAAVGALAALAARVHLEVERVDGPAASDDASADDGDVDAEGGEDPATNI